MCGPQQQGSQGGAMFQPMTSERWQQMQVRRRPLTAQEEEQRRSQSMAWQASGAKGEDPYKYLPQARLDRLPRMPMRRGMYGRA